MKDKVVKILLFLFGFFLLYVVVGIISNTYPFGPKRTYQMSDKDSSILVEMLTEESFSKEWKWKLIDTEQKYDIPSTSNDFLLQSGSRYYIGRINNYKIYFYQYIYEYDNVENIQDITNKYINKWKNEYKSEEMLNLVDENNISEFPNLVCELITNSDFSCVVVHQEENIISEYKFGGKGIYSDSDKKVILNSFLAVILNSN